MSKEEDPDGAVGWFLGQLVRSPATWIGIAAGTAVGFAFADVGPLGGAIGLGSLIAVAAGGLSFLINYGIRSSHRIAQEKKARDVILAQLEKENAVIAQLNGADLANEAGIFEQLRQDRDEIQARSIEISDNVLADHMALVATAIVDTACTRLEELADLVRRTNDPLLESPTDAEIRIDEIRHDLFRAYQAVADARSRLRQIGSQTDSDMIDASSDLQGLSLGTLARKLEEENDLSRRVEERLKPSYRTTIVNDIPSEETDDREAECE